MKKIIEKLMEHAEECLKEYSKKEDWQEQEMECAYKAAKLYETLQTIKMNDGIWDEMQGDETSGAYPRMPRVYYNDGMSHMRGRDAATGRYMSREGSMRGYSHDGGQYYSDSREYRGERSNDGHSYEDRDNRGVRSMHSIKDRSIDALERMIDSAQTEHERQKISKYIEMIEKTDNT